MFIGTVICCIKKSIKVLFNRVLELYMIPSYLDSNIKLFCDTCNLGVIDYIDQTLSMTQLLQEVDEVVSKVS